MARLILRYPDNVIKEVDFEQPRYRIGSDPDNDLVLENEDVAPHQAEIVTSDDSYTLTDLTEDNTTTVNGKRVEEKISITYGDRIAFGPINGLFYPTPKRTVGEKTKFLLYIGAGAGVIIVSIVLIFFFTTRQISTVVSQQIGDAISAEELLERVPKQRGPMVEEQIIEPQLELEAAAGTQEWQEIETLQRESRITRIFQSEELRLPEPEKEMIEKRMAIAVPRGLKKLFFRKIPVPVKEATAAVTPEEGELPGIEELEPLPEGAPELEPEVAFSEELLPELERLPEGEGLFSKALRPFKRLLGGEEPSIFEEEFEIPDFTETPEVPSEELPVVIPERERVEQKIAAQDIQRLVDPLSLIGSFDVPEIAEVAFEESPIYSAEELEESQTGISGGQLTLSQSFNINIESLWKYPEVGETEFSIIRSGMVGFIDDNKFYDFVFGTKNGELIILDGENGIEIMRQDFAKSFYEPILQDIDKDKRDDIVIAFEDGDISAYSSGLGIIWQYNANDRITALPLVVELNDDKTGDIVFVTLGMDVIALDGEAGFEIWRFFDAESEIIYSPVGIEINRDSITDVVFSTVKGFLYALDGKTGWGLWKRELFGKPAGPSCIGDLDGDGNRDIVSLTRNGMLTAYRKDGRLLFTWGGEEGSYSVPPSIGDTDGDGKNEIVLIDNAGVIRVLEGATRRVKWSLETEEGFATGRIALVDVNLEKGLDVVVSTASGALFVLDGRNGTTLALYNSGSYVFATPIVNDINRDRIHEILIPTYSGVVFAVQVTDTKRGFISLHKSYWISPHHDVMNTGHSTSYALFHLWK